MDSMSYRNNRPAPKPSEPAAAAPAPHQTQAAPVRTKRSEPSKRSKKPIIFVAVALLIVVLAGTAWLFMNRGGASAAIDSSKYQALWLSDGSIYFGKLSVINNDYMSLKNVYYLQSKTNNNNEPSPQSVSKQDASDIELIKLGNEIHGPEDEMVVAKDKVLFFENLKPTGTVSKTITQYQTKN